jgi:CheY-like chemotaxis protein
VRVLFVDDNEMNRRVLKHMLTTAGIETVEAADGKSALLLIEENEFDLVLMDLRMPGMDGLEAVEHVRARKDAKAAVHIVVVTADAGQDIRDLCLHAGADDLLTKPVDMTALYDVVAKLMTRSGTGSVLV